MHADTDEINFDELFLSPVIRRARGIVKPISLSDPTYFTFSPIIVPSLRFSSLFFRRDGTGKKKEGLLDPAFSLLHENLWEARWILTRTKWMDSGKGEKSSGQTVNVGRAARDKG